jgi:hypothetical protein
VSRSAHPSRASASWTSGRGTGLSAEGAAFRVGNLLHADVADADVVFVFGVIPLIPAIAAKLEAEARPDCFIASHKFPFPRGWEAHKVLETDDVHLYCRQPPPPPSPLR